MVPKCPSEHRGHQFSGRTEKDAQIGALQSEIAALRAENAVLRQRLVVIERVVIELGNRTLAPLPTPHKSRTIVGTPISDTHGETN